MLCNFIGLLHLTPVIERFSQLHPKLNLQIDFVDWHIDLLAEGYELAIRIAELKDSSLQARRLTSIHHHHNLQYIIELGYAHYQQDFWDSQTQKK